jgi:hypothetical protein
MVAQIGYSVARQSRGQVTLCVVCTMHEETRSPGFLVEPQTKVYGLSVVWPQNHWNGFSRFGLKTGGDSFSQFGLKTGGYGFLSLGLKTGNYGLEIWASKSPRRFLGLGLKTKRAIVCQLRHKTDWRMKTVRGIRRDLMACFAWNQVGLGFPCLASRLAEAQRWVVLVAPSRMSREDYVKDRRVNATGYVRPF